MDLPVGISTLQHTDRWIGVPLCAILTLLRKIFESAAPPGPRQVQRILFVKFAEQGSTVLAIPQFVVRSKWLGAKTCTSSYSKTIDSFST
jgi:hypothetical protein